MRKVALYVVAAAGVAAVAFAVMTNSANAGPADDATVVATVEKVPAGDPTVPPRSFDDADDYLDEMMDEAGVVVAQGDLDGPMITQQPVELP